MAADFPSSPAVGATYTSGGLTWQWDGTKWTQYSLAGGAGFGDAPVDGKIYGRQSAGWAANAIQADAPVDGNYYTRQNGVWVPVSIQTAPAGSFVNKFRNMGMDVWQRGSGFALTGTGQYCGCDGYQVSYGGNPPTVTQGGPIRWSPHSLVLGGVAGNTYIQVYQKIESYLSTPLTLFGGVSSVTVQWAINNQSGASVTPYLYVYSNSTQDNFNTNVQVLPSTLLQPCPNGQTTVVAYTFNLTAAQANSGIQTILYFSTGLTSGTIGISDADIRATPGWAVGLCATPPIPEIRPISHELTLCQRYFMRWNAGANPIPIGPCSHVSATLGIGVIGPTNFRATPSFSQSAVGALQFSGVVGTANATFAYQSPQATEVRATISGGTANLGGTLYVTSGNWVQLSAEL